MDLSREEVITKMKQLRPGKSKVHPWSLEVTVCGRAWTEF